MQVGDFAIFTVIYQAELDTCHVKLDEYDVEGYITNDKLEVGDRSFGEILAICDNHFYLSAIPHPCPKHNELFRLCYKFMHLDGPKDGWAKVCGDAIRQCFVHPIDIIKERSFVESGLLVFPWEYNDCIRRNHAMLFGFYPEVLTEQFTSTNPEMVAKFKDTFSRHYFHSQLWENHNLFNLAIVNIYGDLFLIRVSASLPS